MTTLSEKASQQRNEGRALRGKRAKTGHDDTEIQKAQSYLDVSAGVIIRFIDKHILSKDPTELDIRGFFDHFKEYAIKRGRLK